MSNDVLTLSVAEEKKEKDSWLHFMPQVKLIVSAIIVSMFWNTSVAQFSFDINFPFSWLLAFPGHNTNSIGICAWVFICNAVVDSFVFPNN